MLRESAAREKLDFFASGRDSASILGTSARSGVLPGAPSGVPGRPWGPAGRSRGVPGALPRRSRDVSGTLLGAMGSAEETPGPIWGLFWVPRGPSWDGFWMDFRIDFLYYFVNKWPANRTRRETLPDERDDFRDDARGQKRVSGCLMDYLGVLSENARKLPDTLMREGLSDGIPPGVPIWCGFPMRPLALLVGLCMKDSAFVQFARWNSS